MLPYPPGNITLYQLRDTVNMWLMISSITCILCILYAFLWFFACNVSASSLHMLLTKTSIRNISLTTWASPITINLLLALPFFYIISFIRSKICYAGMMPQMQHMQPPPHGAIDHTNENGKRDRDGEDENVDKRQRT